MRTPWRRRLLLVLGIAPSPAVPTTTISRDRALCRLVLRRFLAPPCPRAELGIDETEHFPNFLGLSRLEGPVAACSSLSGGYSGATRCPVPGGADAVPSSGLSPRGLPYLGHLRCACGPPGRHQGGPSSQAPGCTALVRGGSRRRAIGRREVPMAIQAHSVAVARRLSVWALAGANREPACSRLPEVTALMRAPPRVGSRPIDWRSDGYRHRRWHLRDPAGVT